MHGMRLSVREKISMIEGMLDTIVSLFDAPLPSAASERRQAMSGRREAIFSIHSRELAPSLRTVGMLFDVGCEEAKKGDVTRYVAAVQEDLRPRVKAIADALSQSGARG